MVVSKSLVYNSNICFDGQIHYVDNLNIWASKRSGIYFSEDGGGHWQKITKVTSGRLSGLAASTKIFRRLFRSGVQHIFPFNHDEIVIFASGNVYNLNAEKRKAVKVSEIHGSRPLCIAIDGNRIYYGEYKSNSERKPVRIFCSFDKGRHWKSVWQLVNTRHVHGVFSDTYSERIWVTTGDQDHESAIWVTDDHFASLNKIISGSQQARAVQLLFDKRYIYWGTDTPFEKNYIYRFSRETGEVEKLQAVSGSIFYGCRVGDSFFFSTVCEPSRVNRSRKVVVWRSTNGVDWKEFVNFEKDRFSMKYFQYGQVLFPAGPGDGYHLWCTPFATNYDQTSLKINCN